MDLIAFRNRIRELCRPTGYFQKNLAYEMGLQPTALSNKLNGTGETSLKHTEVKQIIKILAEWEAFESQSVAIELLEMMDLNESSLTPQEWSSYPLTKLIADRNKPALPTVQRMSSFSGSSQKNAGRLPVQLTSLIGRQPEIEETLNLLRNQNVRLLTLTGSGGVGKTRLALQLAQEIEADFGSSVFFVSLASINEPNLVFSTIARTLGIQENGNQSVTELLKSYLEDRKLLLVLDNFEHLLAASGLVQDLMLELPYLKILITSRALTYIYGEHEYVVPPLRLPNNDLVQNRSKLPNLTQLLSYEAIALFVHRAQAVKPDFKLSQENGLAIAQICQHLDGLPLAIELAAVRTKTLLPQRILALLTDRFELLNRGLQSLPARQQTLRALIDWSFDLLDAVERELLIQLSVFAGGADLKAIEVVCWSWQDEREVAEKPAALLLNRLSDLVDKSMLQVVQTEGDEPRFSMLETLREYAVEKRREWGEENALQKRHATYFLSLAQQAEEALGKSQQKAWLDKLELEHDNFRAVLAWAIHKANSTDLNQNEPLENSINVYSALTNQTNSNLSARELALRMCGLLAWFWDWHCHISEGRNWLEQVLNANWAESIESQADSISNWQLRAKVLNAAGNLAVKQNDITHGVAFLEEALALRQKIGQPREIAVTLNNLGVVTYHQGDLPRAQKFYEESLAIKQELGDKRAIALSLNNLAELHRANRDDQKAIALFEENIALLREVGDLYNTGMGLVNLGVAIGDQGDYPRAALLLMESLNVFREVGDAFVMAEALDRLAELIKDPGQLPVAACLFGAADGLRLTIKTSMSDQYVGRYNEAIKFAQAHLEGVVWLEQWEAGQQMTIDEIMNYTQAHFPASVAQPGDATSSSAEPPDVSSPKDPSGLPDGLTRREIDVLKLAATGLTTSQIAENLVLSPLTVNSHLRSIYAKLGITSRSAATLYAVQNKLV